MLLRVSRFLLSSALWILPSLATAQDTPKVEVDISACRGIYGILRAMHDGVSKREAAGKLDALLETRPYETMFRHYNRSWRPNHLPKDVFKRLILSLQFSEEYSPGENERADTMRTRWAKYYTNLSLYEKQLHQLETADLGRLIRDGVFYAQSWLPSAWKIPDFYFVVVPNGGSPAFTIEGSQGYDFFQLAQTNAGEIDLNWLVGTVSHESHHLGIKTPPLTSGSPKDEVAYRVITLCIAEGVATYLFSGPPPGRAPAYPEARFHVLTPDWEKTWNTYVDNEPDIIRHQTSLLEQALAGKLTDQDLDKDMREYWLNGAIGRAYVLGSEMFGAIYTAFGKQGIFAAMQDPRQLFALYNKAIDTKPEALSRCVRIPAQAVAQSLAIPR